MTREEREDVTNGDMIKAMLNPYKICVYEYSVHIYMTEGDFRKAEYQMNCDTSWWNAPYKEGEYKIVRKHGEQEPCDDCISRSAVLAIAGDSCLDLDSYEDTREFCDEINDLPSVTPHPKMGRWIEHFDESGKWYECDQCHTDWGGSVNYCPNCGSKM